MTLTLPARSAATYPDHLYKSPEGYAEVMDWYDTTASSLPLVVESRFVETHLGRTHALVMGPQAAPPLVLVQGYGGSAPLWHRQLPDFAQEYRVYALDLPGQPGYSAPVVPGLFGDTYARWMVDVLDGFGLERAHIAGVCLGGWIALKLGAYAPQRFERAVLLSPVGIARFKVYIRSGVPLVLNFGRDTTAAGKRLLRMAFSPPKSGLPFNRDVARAFLPVIRHYRIGALAGVGDDGRSLSDMFNGTRALLKFVRGEPASTLRAVEVPVLLLVGEFESVYDPVRAVQRVEQHMPHAIAEVVPGTGHAAIYDKPAEVNPRILRFLREGR